MSRVLMFSATLMLGVAAPVVAQAQVPFTAGSPVRVQYQSEDRPIEGSLVSVDHDSFVFRPSAEALQSSAYRSTLGQVVESKYSEVDVLWVDLGQSRKHSAFRGMLWGAYLGASSGAVAGPLVAKSGNHTIGQTSAALGIGGGLVGAGIGAVVGAIVAPEHRWKSYRFVIQ